MSTSIEKEIRKSIKLVTIELIGIINLGKYTLVINWVLPIKLLLDSVSAVAKNCQGSMAA